MTTSTHSSPLILKPSRFNDPATLYAERVLNGGIIAGRLVRYACQRHIDDLSNGHKRGLSWHPEVARYHTDFFRFLRHSKGEYAGQSVKLEPWQCFRVGSVFGWLRKDGSRRFRVAWNEVARKNGKSTEAAGIAADGLIADGEIGAEVYAGATTRDQAKIVFNETRRMFRSSPQLRTKARIFVRSIAVDETGSSFMPLSSDADTLDGLNPHVIIIDEFHRHRTRDMLDVMDSAVGSRRQPLLWIITTAGTDDPETPYAQEREYAEKVVTRVLHDDSLFVYIATLDEGDRWDDPKVWVKANPNLGVSVRADDLRRQATKAKGSPSAQASFKRLRCNVRTGSTIKAIPLERWVECTQGPVDIERMRGRDAYLGLDLSNKLDLTAASLLFPPREADERWTLYSRFWCPAENVDERQDRDRASYRRWIEEGWIEATPGDVIDHGRLRDCVKDWGRMFRIVAAMYDPWNATQMAVQLLADGIPMMEFVQGIKSYTVPTQEFLALIQSRMLEHGGNPVLTWMSSNLAIETDKNNNMMPHKKKSTGRIDGITSAIMAYGGALAEAPKQSRYETGGGIRVL